MKFFFSFSATFFLPDEFLFILPQFCKLYLCYSIYVNAAGKMARIIFVIASCCFFRVCVCVQMMRAQIEYPNGTKFFIIIVHTLKLVIAVFISTAQKTAHSFSDAG